MNVKLHTPKTLKAGSGLATTKQFFLSLLATTISIVLTFGTAGIIDHHKKQAAKKEMAMMIISDFDQTIELVEKIDTSLLECRNLQQDIATHPERFDSLHFKFASAMSWIMDEFPETAERIFSTSIETFNIIGDVNFVNEVSSFYLQRRKYKELLMDELKKQWVEKEVMLSMDLLLNINYPEYVYLNWAFLSDFKEKRDRCMQMAKVSEDDMMAFHKKRTEKEVDANTKAQSEKALDEYLKYQEILQQAKEKLKKK